MSASLVGSEMCIRDSVCCVCVLCECCVGAVRLLSVSLVVCQRCGCECCVGIGLVGSGRASHPQGTGAEDEPAPCAPVGDEGGARKRPASRRKPAGA
eukprot:14968601-Alexandrium_andersonii.AAC.1